MTWMIVGAALVVALLFVVWLSRSGTTPLLHDAARSDTLRGVLAECGLDAHVALEAPSGIPDFALPLGWGRRTRAGAQAIDGSTRWLLYDSELRRDVAGCNAVRGSGGDGVIARHTVVLLQSDSLALPHFTAVPNVRRLISESLPARFREAGLAESKVARVAATLSDTLAGVGEHGRALAFQADPDFEAAFRVTGTDPDAVRALFGESVIRLLMEHRWAIIEGQGSHVAASRNTAPAFDPPDRPEHDRDGFLAPERASQLLAFSQLLAGRLRSTL